ncbi:MAG: TIGR02285 family protein [Aestuariibacter sp.]
MKLTIFQSVCVVLASFCFTTKADTILWHVSHAPPSSFTQGEFKGQGFIDQALQLIQKEIPQYQHKVVPSDIANATLRLKKGELLCFPAMVKTQQRKAFVYFSQMSVMHPSNYVAMSPELAQKKGQSKEADLKALLSNEDIYLGVRDGFAFGQVIDALIQQYGLNSTMIFKEEQSLFDLYQLLANNRIDYLIGYPFESAFVLAQLDLAGRVVNLPIKDVPQFSMGAVGCTKNAWGKEVINAVDNALSKLKPSDAYHNALCSWLDGSVDMSDFDTFYQQQFLPQ